MVTPHVAIAKLAIGVMILALIALGAVAWIFGMIAAGEKTSVEIGDPRFVHNDAGVFLTMPITFSGLPDVESGTVIIKWRSELALPEGERTIDPHPIWDVLEEEGLNITR